MDLGEPLHVGVDVVPVHLPRATLQSFKKLERDFWDNYKGVSGITPKWIIHRAYRRHSPAVVSVARVWPGCHTCAILA